MLLKNILLQTVFQSLAIKAWVAYNSMHSFLTLGRVWTHWCDHSTAVPAADAQTGVIRTLPLERLVTTDATVSV